MKTICDGYTDLAPGKIASVVTYLEMRARPSLPASSSNKVSLRLIQHPALGRYRSLYRRAGAGWLWFSRLEMSDADLSALLNRSTTDLFIAEVKNAENENREIGIAELDRSAPPDVEITNFALFPEAIGKGLGRPFMNAVLDQAWSAREAAGATSRVWLHTCTLDGPAALVFYMKCGFRAYKRAIEVADDPRLRGVLPEDAAPQIPIIR